MAELPEGMNKLIDRIKRDGIEASDRERERILGQAREEAERLVAEAREKAKKLLETADHESGALRSQVEAETRMTVRDFVAGFKQRVSSQIIRPVIEARLTEVLEDPDFLKNALLNLFENALTSPAGTVIMVNEDLKEGLAAWFSHQLSGQLAKEPPAIQGVGGMTGFRLKTGDRGFVWEFTLEAITAEIAAMVEPRLKSFFDLEPPAVAAP